MSHKRWGGAYPDGAQSDFDYDRFGHLIKREGAGAYPLSYNYTSFGEIASYRDAQGAETKFLYDKHGRMTSRIWPNGSATVYKYGKSGLLEVKEEAGRITGYIYDDMNRLVKTQTVLGGEASETLMSYDKDNKLIKITDGKTSIEYSYDKYGRVIVEDGPVGIIRYVYNAEGLLFAKSCEFKENPGQFLTKYYYNEFSRVNKVESQAGIYTYNYDGNGRISSLSMGDKVKIDYAYDKADRLISKILNGETLCKYDYDKLNRRVKAEVNGIKWDYGYDIYNQLTSAKADDGKIYDYSYDKIGNRLKINDVALAYNKLNQISISGYQYDKWGNLIRTPDASYKYDLQNRLIEVKKNNVTVKYSYDPLGQRIEAVENVKGQEKTTKYLMSGMVEQARLSGGVTQYHTLGLDVLQSFSYSGGVGAVLATTNNNSSFNYLYDDMGNVIATLYNSNITEKISYSPFGEIISGKTQIPFTFSTKSADISGLYYYGFRFYDASIGKWLTKDPIEERGGVNFYGVVSNNLINHIDYLGLIQGNDNIYTTKKPGNRETFVYSSNRGTTACWEVSGNLQIVGTTKAAAVRIKPTGDSSSVGDSEITLVYPDGTRETMTVTIRRPYTAQITGFVNGLNVEEYLSNWKVTYSFYYQIKDQLGGPFRYTSVSENIEVLVNENQIGINETGSGTTDGNGIVTDGRTAIFRD